jgi:hypothetical protein
VRDSRDSIVAWLSAGARSNDRRRATFRLSMGLIE